MCKWWNLQISIRKLAIENMCLIDGTWTDPKGFYAEMTIVESSKPTWTDPKGPYAEMTIVESSKPTLELILKVFMQKWQL